MDSVDDISGRLGQYMLQGWVLTDQSCKTPGCSVPMMRSPSSRTPVTLFCANCDDRPGVPRSKPTISTSQSASSATSDSHISRSSTPATEVSSALSSPVFAPPADTAESRRRREQSDTASSEIGKRLLKGWAMLGDECPNARCYGVPLVRPPKAGGEKDPRKECVICGNVYVAEIDWAGRERLVPAESDATRNDTNGLATVSTSSRGKGNVQEATPHASRDILPWHDPTLPDVPIAFSPASPLQPDNALIQTGHPLQALNESSDTLQSTLRALSARLKVLSNSPAAIDPNSIGLTADAIGKVTQALSHVRQLQWSETQAQRL